MTSGRGRERDQFERLMSLCLIRAQVLRLPALGPFYNVCQSFAFGFEFQPYVHLLTEDVQLFQRHWLRELARPKIRFGFFLEQATAPPATAPSCGQQPLHRPSRSSCLAPPEPRARA